MLLLAVHRIPEVYEALLSECIEEEDLLFLPLFWSCYYPPIQCLG